MSSFLTFIIWPESNNSKVKNGIKILKFAVLDLRGKTFISSYNIVISALITDGVDSVTADISLDTDEDLSAQHLIDFSPIYRCLHIYTVLGCKDVFENYYRTQREKQARLVVQPSFSTVKFLHYFLYLWSLANTICKKLFLYIHILTHAFKFDYELQKSIFWYYYFSKES